MVSGCGGGDNATTGTSSGGSTSKTGIALTALEQAEIDQLVARELGGDAKAFEKMVADNVAKGYGFGMLEQAIGEANFTLAKFYILHGADVNAKNERGATLLHEVTLWTNDPNVGVGAAGERIRFLVSHGADVNARCKDGKTPLDWAKEGGTTIVQLIESLGGK